MKSREEAQDSIRLSCHGRVAGRDKCGADNL